MLSKEILLMSKKRYQKIRQIVVEWLQATTVDHVVVVAVCVDHHQERVVGGDLWVAIQILVEAVVVVTGLVGVVAEAMELEEIMVIDLRPTVVVMVVIWEEVVLVLVWWVLVAQDPWAAVAGEEDMVWEDHLEVVMMMVSKQLGLNLGFQLLFYF
jgi:hypothetical protein